MSSAFAHGGSQNANTNNAFARPSPAPFAPAASRSLLPAKRSDNDDGDDDDLQFISAQPVKKRKIAGGSTKYQLKVTPPVAAAPSPQPPPQNDGFWRLPESPVTGQAQSRVQDHSKNADLSQKRRVSTGMVGLLSDIPEIEAAVAMRGVSLPSLESYVFGQSPRRPRPMASPPLSPKQLPSNFQPWDLDSPLTTPSGNVHTTHQPAPDAMDEDTIMMQAPIVTVSPSSRGANVDQSRASSPAQDASVDRHMTSMPAPLSSQTQHEQIPDSLRQIPPSHPHPNMPPAGAARAHGARHPCRICIQMAQREALARARGLPLAMVGQPMPTPAMPQMRGPPIPPYHHLHHQLASMPPTSIPALGSGYLPMVMPMHRFNGIPSHGSGTQPPSQLTSPQLNHPSPQATATAMPPQTAAWTGESSQTTLSPSKPRPGTPRSSFKPPASLIQPTYRKPSPNLIVDVAETCQQKFPFEEVAGRHNVPVDKVIEVFAAIIQVPLLRCPTDRRRPGKLATSRVKEYARAKKGIQEERDAEAGEGAHGNRGEVVATPLGIAQRLGTVELPEEFEMPAQ
jgi:hypothetical protein